VRRRSPNPIRWLAAAAALSVLGPLAGCRAPSRAATLPDHRPRTPSLPIRFEDVAERAGCRYRWPVKPRPLTNIDAFGAGCAFLDYDRDGRLDLLLVGKPRCGLFRNLDGTRFEDVTAATGMAEHAGPWTGCAVGDYDADGWPDLLLTGYHRLRLLRSVGGRRFVDATRAAGLPPDNFDDWGASAGFMDLDRDGDLDLLVLNYVISGPNTPLYCEILPGVRSGCPPSRYEPEFPRLWENVGGRFRDVTRRSGLAATHGKALVVAFADIDGDGWIDFYLGNDGTPADLMLNQGRLRFKNIGVRSGLAYGSTPGHPIAAMGAEWADFDRDGELDIAVSAFSDEPYSLVRRRAPLTYEHVGDTAGITGATFKPLGFGTNWADVDNDGWPDLIFANGHVYDNCEQIDPLTTFRQPLMIFHNRRGERFHDLVPELGGDVARPIVGRGSARGDFDNDGRVDLLVVDFEGAPLLLQNRTTTAHHWVTFHLIGKPPAWQAYGARVVARAGAERWVGQVSPACSYLSSSDPRVHFGLGGVDRLDSVTIHWPSGAVETLRTPPIDRIVVIREGAGIVSGSAAPSVPHAANER